VTLQGELGTEVEEIRQGLLALMDKAHVVDEALVQVANHQASLKASIILSLDALDRIERRLRKR
jgi:hypothetical protein